MIKSDRMMIQAWSNYDQVWSDGDQAWSDESQSDSTIKSDPMVYQAWSDEPVWFDDQVRLDQVWSDNDQDHQIWSHHRFAYYLCPP